MTLTAAEAHERAGRGAAWLDEQLPDWHTSINLAMLDMDNPYHCILGQTGHRLADASAGFFTGELEYLSVLSGYYVARMLVVRRQMSDHGVQEFMESRGFYLMWPAATSAISAAAVQLRVEYEMLQVAWLLQIHQRLEKPAETPPVLEPALA